MYLYACMYIYMQMRALQQRMLTYADVC